MDIYGSMCVNDATHDCLLPSKCAKTPNKSTNSAVSLESGSLCMNICMSSSCVYVVFFFSFYRSCGLMRYYFYTYGYGERLDKWFR